VDTFVTYDELQRALPQGQFYLTQSIPYQIEPYTVAIETDYPLADVSVEVNGEQYVMRTDHSGILNVSFSLTVGTNVIKWRFDPESLWQQVTINATNIGTIHSGVASVLNMLLEEILTTWNNATLSETQYLSPFADLFGTPLLTPERLEEIAQVLYYWVDTTKAVRQISGAVNNVSASVRHIGDFIPDKNIVADWNRNLTEDNIGLNVLTELDPACFAVDDPAIMTLTYVGISDGQGGYYKAPYGEEFLMLEVDEPTGVILHTKLEKFDDVADWYNWSFRLMCLYSPGN